MKIEKIKIKNQIVSILFLNTHEENEILTRDKLVQIVNLGYDYLVLENISFTRIVGWHQHNYNLLNIPSKEYLVEGIHNIGIALKKDAFFKELDFLCYQNSPLCIFVKDRFLPFTIRSKFGDSDTSWKDIFLILKSFNWNLYMLFSERSFFASPDPEIIEQIISIIGMDKSTAEYQEIDYN